MSHIIKKLGNPVLRQPCQSINEINGDVKKLADKLRFALLKSKGFAVAANQIGVSKSMFVYTHEDQVNKVLINPVIKESSNDLWDYDEGCLSVPGYFFHIERPKTVLVEALNLSGDTIQFEASNLHGRIMQHEIQHLGGGLVIDLLNEEEGLKFYNSWFNKGYN